MSDVVTSLIEDRRQAHDFVGVLLKMIDKPMCAWSATSPTFIYANQLFADAIGRSVSEVLSSEFTELITDDTTWASMKLFSENMAQDHITTVDRFPNKYKDKEVEVYLIWNGANTPRSGYGAGSVEVVNEEVWHRAVDAWIEKHGWYYEE